MAEIDQTENEDFNLCWARGDDDARIFTIRKADGSVENISTWTLSMAVNAEKNPVNTDNEVFSVAGTLPGGGTDGKVSFKPPANSLDTVIPSGATKLNAFYDINRLTPSIKTLIKAKVTFLQDVDKST